MAGRGFADITPDSSRSPRSDDTAAPEQAAVTGHPAPHPGVRVPWSWVAALVAVVVTVVVILEARPDSGATGAGVSVAAAHGPTRVVDGVPTGYTRDRAGAATAAVNVVQALTRAGQGRIPIAAVVSALIAPEPGPALRASIEIARDRPGGDGVLNVLPATVTVTEVTADRAEVTVWTMGISHAGIAPGDPVSVMTLWSTHTVRLIWHDGDWKATEKTGHVGPAPEEVLTPASSNTPDRPLEGYHTFYLN